jgi:lantibiotic biosynthesis protein
MRSEPWYSPANAALFRGAALRLAADGRSWPNDPDGRSVGQWQGWLTRTWAQPGLTEAVRLASPVLAERIDSALNNAFPGGSQIRRMALSLARYLVRARGRATPFGLFAGVAVSGFGPTSVRWSDPSTPTRRADSSWLAAIVGQLEGCAPLRHRLPVMVNNLARVRGDRLVVDWQPHAGVGTAGEVSIRYSAAVRAVLHTAPTPLPVRDLIDKLAAEFPAAAAEALDAMVAQLIAEGVLVTSLRPPATSADGLQHVLDQLVDVDAATVGEVTPLVTELAAIQALLLGEESDHGAVSTRMRTLADTVVQPLTIDLYLDAAITLPPQVAAEAAAAGELLLRLTPAPEGHPGWGRYRARFLDRYGPGAIVPVLHLIDQTTGLGFPDHYTASVPALFSRRDERLLALAHQAALDGLDEIVLDDAAAAHGLAGDPQMVPHIDVGVEVRAASLAALTNGAFTLGVCGIGRSAAMTGRFLPVLPAHDRRQLAHSYTSMPPRVDGALVAQLSFPPRQPRMENTQRSPRLLPHLIALGEHRDDGTALALSDLAVTADRDRLWLLSLSHRLPVETVLPHAAARHTMPLLARFLLELPRAAGPAVAPFDWGAAACLPFLPQVRYGRSILSPARWRIDPGALPGPDAPEPVWAAAWAALTLRLRLPSSLSVGDGDRQLRLNINEPIDLTLLRAHLHAATGPVSMLEAPAPAELGWLDGRAHEFVVPMTATEAPAQPPACLAGPLRPLERDDGLLPGGPVLYAKLYGHPELADTILTDHLPVLLAQWGADEQPVWWFVRYRSPTHHLRFRVHTAAFGVAAERFGAWAADLRHHGFIGELTLDTYHPEVGRYGHGPAMSAAEEIFAADSVAAVTQLLVPPNCRRAVTAASLVDLACAVTGSRRAGLRWLLDRPGVVPTRVVRDRQALNDAIALAIPGSAALQELPGGEQVAASWHARRQAAATYSRHLAADASHVTPETVLGSLLHLHYVRVHGIDPDGEAATYRLARAVALAAEARRGQNR